MPPQRLTADELRTVIKLAPLVSIDLVIRNPAGKVLLGLRNNAPARGFYFVPGGMILKNERLRDAFARILRRETNYVASFDDARPLGAFDHVYADNRFGEPGYGTHYVALGYALTVGDTADLKTDDQHSAIGWWTESELLASDRVHDNTKAYFRLSGTR